MEDNEKKYIELHKQIFSHFTGQSLTPHVEAIKNLINETKSETLLDFGCGNALEYKQKNTHKTVWNVDATLYDPGHPKHNVLPDKTFDIVVCTDVMEHIPEDCVDSVLERIFTRAEKAVYFNISIRKAHKLLPNGENAHVNVKPPDWWDAKLSTANQKSIKVVVNYEA